MTVCTKSRIASSTSGLTRAVNDWCSRDRRGFQTATAAGVERMMEPVLYAASRSPRQGAPQHVLVGYSSQKRLAYCPPLVKRQVFSLTGFVLSDEALTARATFLPAYRAPRCKEPVKPRRGYRSRTPRHVTPEMEASMPTVPRLGAEPHHSAAPPL